MPSIIVSLGIGLQFRLLDDGVRRSRGGASALLEDYTTSLGLFTSGLGAHLTWTLPFGLLIMFAVFNRFNPAYEEAARDLGATPWQTFRHVVLPIIGPSLVGIGMFGFTLRWDEIARSLAGDRRPQHAAARAAGPDDDRHDAGDLRARHADHRRIVSRHRDCAGAVLLARETQGKKRLRCRKRPRVKWRSSEAPRFPAWRNQLHR